MRKDNIVLTVLNIIVDESLHPVDRAKQILKLMLGTSPTSLKDHIIEFERESWRRSGFPDGYEELNIERDKIIDIQYKGLLAKH